MADRVLLMTWGQTVRGAEERALEVFNEALGLLGRRQQEGKIEGFDVVLLDPNEHANGFMIVRGTTAQIDALRADEEFVRNSIEASLIVDRLAHIEGHTNEGVARTMTMYQEAI